MPEPIIIKGGSVTITFNRQVYTPVKWDPNTNQGEQTITRITVTDDNTGRSQDVPVPDNGMCTITIDTK